MARVAACAAAVALATWAPPRPARAQLQFVGDAPRVYTIEPRLHRYAHELTLGVGFLPLDAFYLGVAADVSYTYRFTPVWQWEMVHAFYSFSLDTPLKDEVASVGAAQSEQSKTRMRLMLSTDLVVRPLYGKFTLFNRGIAQADAGVVVGAGIANSNVDTRFAANVGASVHIWATQALAVRLDLRDYVVIGHSEVENILTFGVAGAFDFNVRLADPEPLPDEVLP